MTGKLNLSEVNEVLEAEKTADGIIAKAEHQKEEIIAQAKEKALGIVAKEKEKINEKMNVQLEQERKTLEKEQKKIIDGAQSQAAKLVKSAKANLGKAEDLVFETILKEGGRSAKETGKDGEM